MKSLPQQQGRIGDDRRHFHQLFRRLRVTKNRKRVNEAARKPATTLDLGRFDNLSHHQRHRSVENRQKGVVDDLLHGAPLYPLLWPPRLTQTGWPGTPGRHHVFVGELIVLGACRVGRRSRPELGRVLRLALLLPGPGRLLSS